MGYSRKRIAHSSVHASYSRQLGGEVTVSKAGSSDTGNKTNEIIIAVEIEEDDESASSKKQGGTSHYPISYLYAPEPGGDYCNGCNRLPFCEHFSRTSSYKFILHRVIRI
ncbi:hypothetical protein HB364_24050 [Pseudoflavitalea sp. X16]|uniref:hypothetical protein n=1 Tax=Paraflavitalea devenefica TaxID=2716334 RepID=UPI00141EB3FE|nr:hypothetical protein [Paraflavitalea devenefica]NII28177.1 hypothetical protein [Paraflavitalea devenefica]